MRHFVGDRLAWGQFIRWADPAVDEAQWHLAKSSIAEENELLRELVMVLPTRWVTKGCEQLPPNLQKSTGI